MLYQHVNVNVMGLSSHALLVSYAKLYRITQIYRTEVWEITVLHLIVEISSDISFIWYRPNDIFMIQIYFINTVSDNSE